mgnify:CR=1 FL=1
MAKETELPTDVVYTGIDVYDYELGPINPDEFAEDYDWCKNIYKYEWKCVCGNTAHMYNVRYGSHLVGEEFTCQHCGKVVHTMDNRNWG